MDYYRLDKDKTFLVSLKAILISGGEILILRFPKSNDKKWSLKWQLPGGLLEMNEDIKQGLKRELKEEAGLEINVGKVFAISDFKYKDFTFRDKRKLNTRIVEIGFMCTSKNKKIRLSSEHKNYKWIKKEDLGKLDFGPDSKDIIKEFLRF